MANEVDNSKELNERKINVEAELQREIKLITLKALARLFHDVEILRIRVKFLNFSVIALSVSFIFLCLLYWL